MSIAPHAGLERLEKDGKLENVLNGGKEKERDVKLENVLNGGKEKERDEKREKREEE